MQAWSKFDFSDRGSAVITFMKLLVTGRQTCCIRVVLRWRQHDKASLRVSAACSHIPAKAARLSVDVCRFLCLSFSTSSFSFLLFYCIAIVLASSCVLGFLFKSSRLENSQISLIVWNCIESFFTPTFPTQIQLSWTYIVSVNKFRMFSAWKDVGAECRNDMRPSVSCRASHALKVN